MTSSIEISEIYSSFDANMRGLYGLNMLIQASVAEKEWESLRSLLGEAFSFFQDEDITEIQRILDRLIQIDAEDEVLDYKKIWEAMNVDGDDIYRFKNDKEIYLKEIQDGLKEWARLFPEHANRFFRVFLKLQRQPPIQSELSRQGLLLSAVSQFEFLLLHLLRAYFSHYEHDLELSDDYTIEELDEKICQRINKRDLQQFSMQQKMEFLTQRFPLFGGFSRDILYEIFERRNAYTHRSGRANENYVKHNLRTQVGDGLRINKNYLGETIEFLHLWGLILCQKIWEKTDSGNDPKANKALIASSMRFIQDERYQFGTVICSQVFLNNIKFESQMNRDLLLINFAICQEKLGNKKGMRKTLSRVRQNPRLSVHDLKDSKLHIVNEPLSYRILMAVNALEGDKDQAIEFMEKAIGVNEITFLDLDYWVIFDYLSDDLRFKHISARLESKIKIA